MQYSKHRIEDRTVSDRLSLSGDYHVEYLCGNYVNNQSTNQKKQETKILITVYAVSGTSRCLFSDKYKTHKYDAQTILFKDPVRTAL